MTDLLWSASTTMRNPERAIYFLKTLSEIDGELWNHDTQEKFQILLIKNRYYSPGNDNLTQQQINLLHDSTREISYEQARDIFITKDYKDPPMRGRTSFDPLEKMGLAKLIVDKNHQKHICITSLGKSFIQGEITLAEVVLHNLLKFQYPNPLTTDCSNYCSKPFINILRLIRYVDSLCEQHNRTVKGISKIEFGIFALSIRDYRDVERMAQDLLNFRDTYESMADYQAKEEYRRDFVCRYLPTFINPVENTKEYSDNIIRYLRLTKYIFIRGGGSNVYVDLERRRKTEIDAILGQDDGRSLTFTSEQAYQDYISDINAYVLPFETIEKLQEIARNVVTDINSLCGEVGVPCDSVVLAQTKETLKQQIASLRDRRSALQNMQLKQNFSSIVKIDETINALRNIRKQELKPSVALEKWSNVLLNIIDDAELIKPNAPVGDDNEPTMTAGANVPDIECYYEEFSAICEVTMLTTRDQWYNEGQPVMRHLRTFENINHNLPVYCIFMAPKIHQDTLNTFWTSVKYEYEGQPQKIVPLTIEQMIRILEVFKLAKTKNKHITNAEMLELYSKCVDVSNVENSTKWCAYINTQIDYWGRNVLDIVP